MSCLIVLSVDCFRSILIEISKKKNTATAKINEGGSKKKERNFSKHIYQLRLTMRRATQIEDSYIMITFLLLREQ